MVDYATSGRVKDELLIVCFCEEFGWTYQEAMEQPLWFINLIRDKWEIDTKKANAKSS